MEWISHYGMTCQTATDWLTRIVSRIDEAGRQAWDRGEPQRGMECEQTAILVLRTTRDRLPSSFLALAEYMHHNDWSDADSFVETVEEAGIF